jgi:hypothetical protein
LWKTETQLRGPLAHCLRYSSNLGWSAWTKGPMKGILNIGPAMGPLRQRYMTAECQFSSHRAWMWLGVHTLIVGNEEEENGDRD